MGRKPKKRATKLGNFLFELREKRGLTIQEIADKTGLPKSTISKWELGTTVPNSVRVLQKLARFYGIPFEEWPVDDEAKQNLP